jgi:hypothetical protein
MRGLCRTRKKNLGNKPRRRGGLLDTSGKGSARRDQISGVRSMKPTRANESRAGIPDIQRRRHGIEPCPVLPTSSVVAAKPSCPKPPEPTSGGREVIKMILKNNEKESVIRVLLDCGGSNSILNKKWALRNNIQKFERTYPKVVENFACKIEPEIGLAYNYPVRLQH